MVLTAQSMWRESTDVPDADDVPLSELQLRWFFRWSARGGLSIADQALVSGAHLLVNVLLARWLGAEPFGIFALGFAGLLLLMGFHEALILEPMSVLGPSTYGDRLGAYFRAQLRLHLRVVGAPALLIVIAGIVSWAFIGKQGSVLVGAGGASPLIFLFFVFRRFFYLTHRPGAAAIGSAAYFLASLLSLSWISAAHVLSPASAFGALAAGAVIATVVLAWMVRPSSLDRGLDTSEVLRQHWNYGRWMVASSVLYLLSFQAQLFLAAGFLGLGAAGAMRAMHVLIAPLMQGITAILSLTLPVLSRDFSEGNLQTLRRKAFAVGLVLVAASFAYEIILLLFRVPIVTALYGADFDEFTWLVPLMGVIGIIVAVTAGYSLVLRAAQRPQHHLFAIGITAPVALVSALMFTWLWGLAGAAASLILSYGTGALVTAMLYRSWSAGATGRQEAREDANAQPEHHYPD